MITNKKIQDMESLLDSIRIKEKSEELDLSNYAFRLTELISKSINLRDEYNDLIGEISDFFASSGE